MVNPNEYGFCITPEGNVYEVLPGQGVRALKLDNDNKVEATPSNVIEQNIDLSNACSLNGFNIVLR